MTTPVTICGVTYRSMTEAARETGHHVSVISAHAKRGKLESLSSHIPRNVPVRIRGVTYRSMTEAARALNLDVSTVFDALERGTLDNVGCGRFKYRYECDGVPYDTVDDIAKLVGAGSSALKSRLTRSYKDCITFGKHEIRRFER